MRMALSFGCAFATKDSRQCAFAVDASGITTTAARHRMRR
ncbi:hypothetical protein LINGRAHAP2_LOCUS11436 [Linum grandiflorum]